MTSQITQLFWENLIVTVPTKGDDECSRELWCKFSRRKPVKVLNILKGVSGYAEIGNMFAILGPSGAGKTTFLAALARRLELTSGVIKINGYDVSPDAMEAISSYMSQFDILPSALTPREHMSFMCALKIGSSCSMLRRKSLGEEFLRDLGLYECIDIAISELSGGEKKRLLLAAELVTRPKIFFLDEPTTGLDTFAATCVVQSLKLIASRGTIVFCTIHQPGMTIYNMFSHVILMTNGRSVYFGTLKNAMDFFESQDYQCPINYDESEYYVNVLSCCDRADRNIELCRAFSRSPLSKIPAVESIPIFYPNPRKKSGRFVQFYWLLWRIFLRDKRTALENWIAWFSCALSIVFITSFYVGTNSSTQEGIQSARGVLYLTISEVIFMNAYSVIFELPNELVLYVRESTVYSPGPYYLATFLALISKATFKAFLFTVALYFVLHFEFSLLGFCSYCLCTTAAAISSIAYGLMMSSWIADVDAVTTIMIPIDLLFLLTAGTFYNLRTLPSYLAYVKYSSIFYYATEAISIIHWSEVNDIDCPFNRSTLCLSNGTEVLSEYGYNEQNFWWDMTGLLLLTILMNVVAYLGTRRRRVSRPIAY
ncbi:protein brown [Monomorium pharaonis]|uniref:protein brown n=1 Tax=Monomorium pharaonis TaxID=307658 RepID=UPI001746D7C4|nr:protein brown [Monomorium pharaonis]XP_012533859.2 protein brown [Monomorium pharaonis]XP_012533860.2 protein brown [Monomorium pharaonis]